MLQMRTGFKIDARDVLGGIQTDSNGDIVNASAAYLQFIIRNDRQGSSDGGWESPKAEAWEKAFLDTARGFSIAGMRVDPFATRTFLDEFLVRHGGAYTTRI